MIASWSHNHTIADVPATGNETKQWLMPTKFKTQKQANEKSRQQCWLVAIVASEEAGAFHWFEEKWVVTRRLQGLGAQPVSPKHSKLILFSVETIHLWTVPQMDTEEITDLKSPNVSGQPWPALKTYRLDQLWLIQAVELSPTSPVDGWWC